MMCYCGILSLATTYFENVLKFRRTRHVHSADAAWNVERIDGITLDPASESFRTKVTYINCIWNICRLRQCCLLNIRKGRRDIRESVGSYCACIMRLNGSYFFFRIHCTAFHQAFQSSDSINATICFAYPIELNLSLPECKNLKQILHAMSWKRIDKTYQFYLKLNQPTNWRTNGTIMHTNPKHFHRPTAPTDKLKDQRINLTRTKSD